MSDYLYFAADLYNVVLSLPDPPPAALWYQPHGGSGAKLISMHLLTTETYARILFQVHKAGKIHDCQALLKPLDDWSRDHFAFAAIEAELDRLERIGGPRVPLPRPDALAGMATPFEVDDFRAGVFPRGHWEGVKFIRDAR